VEYRPGRLNTVADALSRRDIEEAILDVISMPSFQFYHQIRAAISSCPQPSALRNNIVAGLKEAIWTVKDDLIFKAGKIFIPPNSELLQQVLQIAHTGDHEGTKKKHFTGFEPISVLNRTAHW
jgi:hypothetical protein